MDLQILSQLKMQHESLFALTIALEDNDQEFIFRPIGREEYRLVLEEYEHHKDLAVFQEHLCQFCVLYPMTYIFSEGAGGVAELLADAILDVSGLFEEQGLELLMENRAKMQNFDYQIECMIHEAFPEYTLDEIGSWDMRKTMYFYARAEWILVNLRGVKINLIPDQNMQQTQVMQVDPRLMQQPQYQPVKDMNNDFEEVRMVPIDADYETDPTVLVKMKASELNDHQKQIAEQYTYNMLGREATARGSKVGKIEKVMHSKPMPELGFFAHDFEIGRD